MRADAPRARRRDSADAILIASRFGLPARPLLKLIATLTSPYARKVRIALAEKKIEYALVVDSPWVAGNTVAEFNPLGKIPVLVLDDGTRAVRFARDRRVPRTRESGEPAHPGAVAAAHRRETLGGARRRHLRRRRRTIFLERKRPARQQSKDWIERQRDKIDLGVVELARGAGRAPWCNGEGYSLADIATGCALGYLDLRFPEIDWRDAHPNLVALAEKLAARPSFADTVPPAGASGDGAGTPAATGTILELAAWRRHRPPRRRSSPA